MWELRTSFEGAYIFLSKLLSNPIMGLLEKIHDAGFHSLRQVRDNHTSRPG